MKLTREDLNQIIKEELTAVLQEKGASASYCKSTPCSKMGFTQKASCKSQGLKDCYDKKKNERKLTDAEYKKKGEIAKAIKRDNPEMSDDDVNIELRRHMESWKVPLREYYQPYELPRILTSLGAKNAKDYNIKNWQKQDTIRPKDDDDFKALLKFADIPEVEFPAFFGLAKNIRSNCISIGHRKSEVSREIVAKELRKRLQHQDTLPSSFNVGKIKASILVVG